MISLIGLLHPATENLSKAWTVDIDERKVTKSIMLVILEEKIVLMVLENTPSIGILKISNQ